MSFARSNISLQNVLPSLSSMRHSFFEDEKEQLIQALINCPHFYPFKSDEGLRKAFEQCYHKMNYFLFGTKKILHQYGKNSENQFFILKGEANIYEYKKDSELEIECYYTAARAKLKETIDQKQIQLTNILQTVAGGNQTGDNKIATSSAPQSKENLNLPNQVFKEMQIQLNKDIFALESEVQAIESLLEKQFGFFDPELDVVRDYDQFFIDEVCLLKFIRKLKENESFGTVDNNRDQIIVSASEIHLTNIPTEVYQIHLIPLKAVNEFFAFYLKECKLDTYFLFRNITESYFSKTTQGVVYDCQYKNTPSPSKSPKKPKKGKKKQNDESSSSNSDSSDGEDQQNNLDLQKLNSLNTTSSKSIKTFYLVRSGIFQMSKFKEKRFLPIRTLVAGDFFGIEDLFLDSHQFRVTCQSEKGSVLVYSLPTVRDGLSPNLYQSGEFISSKQKERVYEVQQKFLQYYIKVYLDVLEQSTESSKKFQDVFSPIIAKLLRKEKEESFRKKEEGREKKYIRLDGGIILEMPVEDDAPRGRFDLKLQPYVINTAKSSYQSSLQNIQLQPQQSQQQQQQQQQQLQLQQLSQQLTNLQQQQNGQNPNMGELVNKLQMKINSRKSSQEKIILRKKGSQQQITVSNQQQGQSVINGMEQSALTMTKNANTAFNQQRQTESHNNNYNNQFTFTNQAMQQETLVAKNSSPNLALIKQSIQTNYQFQPYAAKPNSRDISPQTSMRNLKKNFSIAPIQQERQNDNVSAAAAGASPESRQRNDNKKNLSQTSLEEVKDSINTNERDSIENIKADPLPLHIVIKQNDSNNNIYHLNSKRNKAIPKSYFMDVNSPMKLQQQKSPIFKKQNTSKTIKDLNGVSPLVNRQKSLVYGNESQLQTLHQYAHPQSAATVSNRFSHNNQPSSVSNFHNSNLTGNNSISAAMGENNNSLNDNHNGVTEQTNIEDEQIPQQTVTYVVSKNSKEISHSPNQKERRILTRTLGEKTSAVKLKSTTNNESSRLSQERQNINQSSSENLPYISSNLSSSSHILSSVPANKNSKRNSNINNIIPNHVQIMQNGQMAGASITNGFQQKLQMTNSQKSRSFNNLNFKTSKVATEGSESNRYSMINFNQDRDSSPVSRYHQSIPSLSNIDNQAITTVIPAKQNSNLMNQIYFDMTSSLSSTQKPATSMIQSLNQSQENLFNFQQHNTSKLTSSVMFPPSPNIEKSISPDSSNKIKSDRLSEQLYRKPDLGQKLIQLQQQSHDKNINSKRNNTEFLLHQPAVSSSSTSQLNQPNYNKQMIQSASTSKLENTSITTNNTNGSILGKQLPSQTKIQGLLESKTQKRNLSNSSSAQKLLASELNPSLPFKSQILQQSYNQKVNSPSLIEKNFSQQQ